jgi:selenocysteine lyase/cysteine desulfurase
MNQREFLRTVGSASLAMVFGDARWARLAAMPARTLAAHEDFWATLRRRYVLTTDYINLENGYYSIQSQPVLESFIGGVRDINVRGSRYMRTRQVDDKLAVRKRLAAMAGCSHEELIITRNTTESLDTVISGFDWRAGDEAVMAAQDYGSMLDMFALQGRRHGMVNRVVSLPLHPASDDDVVGLYERAITPQTRLVMVCHMVNITGHILPVAKICDMAHSRGVPVMVDGAHTFAQLTFTIPGLHCDYFGSSLHKWLGTPLGAGILYVRRDRIAPLWPIFSDHNVADDDIAKLNHTGTHPVHTDLAINSAIDFHDAIGSARKEARLRYLQQYWTSELRGLSGITINTPVEPERCCAIANVGVERLTPADLAKTLFDKHRVWTVAIDGAGVRGVRVTPQLFTTTDELDQLVRAIKEIAG